MDYSKELALFLEKIRFQRGISQEDFTDGIISNRQYQRYVRGESPMPFHLLNDFAIKLNLKKEDLIIEFQNRSIDETSRILNYFSSLTIKNHDQIETIKSKISRDFILESDNLKLYDHTVALEKYLKKEISVETLESMLVKICNFPKILETFPISLVDALILSSLLTYTKSKDKELISSKIIDLIKNPNYTFTAYQITVINILIFSLAKFYGINKNFDKCVEICSFGISFNKRKDSTLNLFEYYYFMTLSYFKLENIEKFELYLFKCYNGLNLLLSDSKKSYYKSLIEKDFSINLDEFALKYIKEKA